MDVRNALRRLLDAVEGHEDRLANEISKRTSVTETQVHQGIALLREEVTDSESAN